MYHWGSRGTFLGVPPRRGKVRPRVSWVVVVRIDVESSNVQLNVEVSPFLNYYHLPFSLFPCRGPLNYKTIVT